VVSSRPEIDEPAPDEHARLRVEAGRGLVQDDELGVCDERPRDDEAPLHAAGELHHLRVGTLDKLHELEQ